MPRFIQRFILCKTMSHVSNKYDSHRIKRAEKKQSAVSKKRSLLTSLQMTATWQEIFSLADNAHVDNIETYKDFAKNYLCVVLVPSF